MTHRTNRRAMAAHSGRERSEALLLNYLSSVSHAEGWAANNVVPPRATRAQATHATPVDEASFTEQTTRLARRIWVPLQALVLACIPLFGVVWGLAGLTPRQAWTLTEEEASGLLGFDAAYLVLGLTLACSLVFIYATGKPLALAQAWSRPGDGVEPSDSLAQRAGRWAVGLLR